MGIGEIVQTNWQAHQWVVEVDEPSSRFTVTFTPTESEVLLEIAIGDETSVVSGATIAGSLDTMRKFNPFTVESLTWS